MLGIVLGGGLIFLVMDKNRSDLTAGYRESVAEYEARISRLLRASVSKGLSAHDWN